MRRFALVLAVTAVVALPTVAQAYEGNWSCRDASTERVGILTIYGEAYGWASRTMGDPNSGSGSLALYQDGVGFSDGNFRTNGGAAAARVIDDPTHGIALQIETADAIVMLCTPR